MYELIETHGAPIKAWVRGVPCGEAVKRQLRNIATKGAVVPAAVGVDIGCGMMAVQTELRRDNLPSGLGNAPARVQRRWEQLLPGYERLVRAAIGGGRALLLRGHGANVAESDVRRAIVLACFLEEAARTQLDALAAGGGDDRRLRFFTPEEAERARADLEATGPINRAWDYYAALAGGTLDLLG